MITLPARPHVAGTAEGLREALRSALRPAPQAAGSAPATPTVAASAEQMVEEAARGALGHGRAAVPVVDHAGRAVGVLRAADVAALHPAERAERLVGTVAVRDRELLAGPDDDVAALRRRPAVAAAGLGLVVDRRGVLLRAVEPA
ncbi:CBS domain-containing protein [Patulibacter sp. SYSU D01012]|uniref:CBS domain-containing protein n=1 Tax=Patulibacter sp. SYSU D01012 TaxID=2817381 RepID=UPI001B30B464|nr:CBS domain-containing protein [Patulibacter sp. SYSU D01012]